MGSKSFTESVILGELAVGLLADAGENVAHAAELGGTGLVWAALRSGELDVYPDYTGTLRREILARRNIGDDGELVQALAELGLGITAPLGFNNTYVLGTRKETAAARGLRKISDLRQHPDLRFGFTNEFMERKDGWPGLKARYRLPQNEVAGLHHDLAYRGLLSGDIDVMDLYATDAEIGFYGLRVLQDDLAYFPPYQAVFVYRKDLEQRAPKAVAALSRLCGRLNQDQMRRLNGRVKPKDPAKRVSEHQAAADFLHHEFGIRMTMRDEGRLGQVLWRARQHLVLTLVSLLAAVLVSVPLGIVSAQQRAWAQAILGTTGILLTIPSLALLVFMIPLLGIGFLPAVVALFLYSLLPIDRNTYSGLVNIPGELIESADALGLSRRSRLFKIELPLALPQILAGIKISAVLNVGTATLAAFIMAGGLGQLILTGVRRDDTELILLGAIPAALLALLVLGLFELLERRLVSPGIRP